MAADFDSVDFSFLREYISELECEAATIEQEEVLESLDGEESEESIVGDLLTMDHPVETTQRDIIDRFLQCHNTRIVIDESLVIDEESDELGDVEIAPSASLDPNFASEELAKIYRDQGLYSKSIDIYRQLSLLNSEKSAYFAEQIAQIEIIKHKK